MRFYPAGNRAIRRRCRCSRLRALPRMRSDRRHQVSKLTKSISNLPSISAKRLAKRATTLFSVDSEFINTFTVQASGNAIGPRSGEVPKYFARVGGDVAESLFCGGGTIGKQSDFIWGEIFAVRAAREGFRIAPYAVFTDSPAPVIVSFEIGGTVPVEGVDGVSDFRFLSEIRLDLIDVPVFRFLCSGGDGAAHPDAVPEVEGELEDEGGDVGIVGREAADFAIDCFLLVHSDPCDEVREGGVRDFSDEEDVSGFIRFNGETGSVEQFRGCGLEKVHIEGDVVGLADQIFRFQRDQEVINL